MAVGVLGLAAVACASGAATVRTDGGADKISPAVAVATFDSLWSMVRRTYVDTAFVSSTWMAVRDSLRPKAKRITDREQLNGLYAETLGYIHDSHFYIIPAHIAPVESSHGNSDGRGSTGLAVRVADGNVVAWRVEPGSPAALSGIRPGQKIVRIQDRKTDSAMKRVHALPDPAQPRAMADMLHGLNARLSPGVGDTVSVWVESRKGRAEKFSLAAVPGAGLISQFGNLPPIAGLVKTTRVPLPQGCVGVIAFNIWLPALSTDLEKAVDSVRTCDGIVIDLRGNPGGLGAMVMGFGGYFMDSTRSLGTMKTRDVALNFVINPRSSRSDGRMVAPYSGPLAIIVDPMTASTSEIFAAGMQRIGRARVFGERSAGAALPAMMERLPSGDVFVHAVADFTDPLGKRIEGSGAVPDVEVPLRVRDLVAGKDAPVDSAVAWIERK